MDESSSMVTLTLPWPPSVNNYWRRNGGRYFVSSQGKRYREEVCITAYPFKYHFLAGERLSITIKAFPPDKRRRDLDNILKSLLDSLQHASVYADDAQIDSLLIQRQQQLEAKVEIILQKYYHQGISSSTKLESAPLG